MSDSLIPVETLAKNLLPDEVARSANHFWRIDGGDGNGVFVAASDTSPVCNVVGGGPSDFQPSAEALVSGAELKEYWKPASEKPEKDVITSRFQFKTDSRADLIITHAAKSNDRTDRVQFMATVLYNIGN